MNIYIYNKKCELIAKPIVTSFEEFKSEPTIADLNELLHLFGDREMELFYKFGFKLDELENCKSFEELKNIKW